MAQVFIKEHLVADNNPALLVSAKNSTDAMENGMVVALGSRTDGSTYAVAKATDVVNQTLVIVNAPIIIEIDGIGRVEGLEDPTLFTIPVSRPARTFKPVKGDTFFISADAITGSPVAGQYAIAKNGQYKFDASATVTTASVAILLESAKTVRVGSGANLKTVAGFVARVVKAEN